MNQNDKSAITPEQRAEILQRIQAQAKELHMMRLRRHFAATIAHQAERALREREVMRTGEAKTTSDTPDDAKPAENLT